jgi:hypothetical protein
MKGRRGGGGGILVHVTTMTKAFHILEYIQNTFTYICIQYGSLLLPPFLSSSLPLLSPTFQCGLLITVLRIQIHIPIYEGKGGKEGEGE